MSRSQITTPVKDEIASGFKINAARRSAVNRDAHPRDERGRRRYEEAHEIGDVFGVAIRLTGYSLAASANCSSIVLPADAACWARRLSQRAVAVAAGDTAVTRMFYSAPRSASPFEKFMSPDLAMPPVRQPGVGFRAGAPATLPMRPPP